MKLPTMRRVPLALRIIPLLCIIFVFILLSQYKSYRVEYNIERLIIGLYNISVENNGSIQNETAYYEDFGVFYNVWKEYLGDISSIELGVSGIAENRGSSFIDYYKSSGRIVMNKEPTLSMDCSSIRRRILRFHHKSELNNAFAIARNVYEGYYLQEILLAQSYTPSNTYCYVFDNKSSEAFVDSMNKMASCLPNVILQDEVFDFDSSGHYQNHAHFACMKTLLHVSDWKYVLLLQNADVFIKTPNEVSNIIGILNGAPLFSSKKLIQDRLPNAVITAKTMNLFLNETNKTEEQMETILTPRKSPVHMLLPREFVSDMVNSLNLSTILDVFNNKTIYGTDEFLFPTLVSNPFLGLAGQLENRCEFPTAMRYVHRNDAHRKPGEIDCLSGQKRHGVCLLGVEYLPDLKDSPLIFANKVWPSFDLGTLMCIDEMLRKNKDSDRDWIQITKFYSSVPHVREYRLKEEGEFDISTFEC